jgi:L-ascorbate metabolism protein UlaG (beta-lactamase superfamily)
VLISHLHHDLRSLRSLGRDRTVLVPGDTGRFFRRHGFTDVVAMQSGVTRQVGIVSVTTTPAAHDGSRLPLGPRRGAVGYVVTAGEQRLYVAGDTGLFEEMAELGRLDEAVIPIAGWGRELGPAPPPLGRGGSGPPALSESRGADPLGARCGRSGIGGLPRPRPMRRRWTSPT